MKNQFYTSIVVTILSSGFSGGGFTSSTATNKKSPSIKHENTSPTPSDVNTVDVENISAIDGHAECVTKGSSFEIDDWKPYINAPTGFLYGKQNIADLKTVKDSGDGNIVLASAKDLAVGAEFPGKSYLLSGYELYNDTGEKNHFGNG